MGAEPPNRRVGELSSRPLKPSVLLSWPRTVAAIKDRLSFGMEPVRRRLMSNNQVQNAMEKEPPNLAESPKQLSMPTVLTQGWTLESILEKGENFIKIPRMSIGNFLADRGLDTVERQGMPLIVQYMDGEAGWEKEMLSADWLTKTCGDQDMPVRNVRDFTDKKIKIRDYIEMTSNIAPCSLPGETERLYGKDVVCPPEWEEWLRSGKVVPEVLVPRGKGDLLRHLPLEYYPENLMCYLGIGDTYTPAHKDLCGSFGHNLMAYTENDGCAYWFMTKTSDAPAVSDFFHSLGGGVEVDLENHTLSIEELARAPFQVFVEVQKMGDMVLVPPRSVHQVVNAGGLTIKISWSRMTLSSLEMALRKELDIYRRVCRIETYRCKLLTYHTVLRLTDNLEVNGGASLTDLKLALELFEEILIAEWSPTSNDIPCLPKQEHPAICDFCECDIFQSLFVCDNMSCASYMEIDDKVFLCVGCYVEGRTCHCGRMLPKQIMDFEILLGVRDKAKAVLAAVERGDNGVLEKPDQDADTSWLDSLKSPHFFRAALLLILERERSSASKKGRAQDQSGRCRPVRKLAGELEHDVSLDAVIKCGPCHAKHCYSHLLDVGILSWEVLLTDRKGRELYELHSPNNARERIAQSEASTDALALLRRTTMRYSGCMRTNSGATKAKLKHGFYDVHIVSSLAWLNGTKRRTPRRPAKRLASSNIPSDDVLSTAWSGTPSRGRAIPLSRQSDTMDGSKSLPPGMGSSLTPLESKPRITPRVEVRKLSEEVKGKYRRVADLLDQHGYRGNPVKAKLADDAEHSPHSPQTAGTSSRARSPSKSRGRRGLSPTKEKRPRAISPVKSSQHGATAVSYDDLDPDRGRSQSMAGTRKRKRSLSPSKVKMRRSFSPHKALRKVIQSDSECELDANEDGRISSRSKFTKILTGSSPIAFPQATQSKDISNPNRETLAMSPNSKRCKLNQSPSRWNTAYGSAPPLSKTEGKERVGLKSQTKSWSHLKGIKILKNNHSNEGPGKMPNSNPRDVAQETSMPGRSPLVASLMDAGRTPTTLLRERHKSSLPDDVAPQHSQTSQPIKIGPPRKKAKTTPPTTAVSTIHQNDSSGETTQDGVEATSSTLNEDAPRSDTSGGTSRNGRNMVVDDALRDADDRRQAHKPDTQSLNLETPQHDSEGDTFQPANMRQGRSLIGESERRQHNLAPMLSIGVNATISEMQERITYLTRNLEHVTACLDDVVHDNAHLQKEAAERILNLEHSHQSLKYTYEKLQLNDGWLEGRLDQLRADCTKNSDQIGILRNKGETIFRDVEELREQPHCKGHPCQQHTRWVGDLQQGRHTPHRSANGNQSYSKHSSTRRHDNRWQSDRHHDAWSPRGPRNRDRDLGHRSDKQVPPRQPARGFGYTNSQSFSEFGRPESHSEKAPGTFNSPYRRPASPWSSPLYPEDESPSGYQVTSGVDVLEKAAVSEPREEAPAIVIPDTLFTTSEPSGLTFDVADPFLHQPPTRQTSPVEDEDMSIDDPASPSSHTALGLELASSVSC